MSLGQSPSIRRPFAYIRILVFCLALLPALVLAQAGEPVALAVLVDPDGTETIERISAPARAHEFIEVTNGFSAGYTRKVHWFRFTLGASAHDNAPIWLVAHPPYLDDLRLFVPDSSRPNGFEVRRAGDHLPFSAREIPYRGFVFTLRPNHEQSQTYYMRLETSSTSVLSLTRWSPKDFQDSATLEYGLFGLFYGVIVMIILINLWPSLWRTEALFRYYLIYLGTTVLNLLSTNGFVGQYLLPEMPLLENAWTSVSTLLLLASAARFYQLVLEVTDKNPALHIFYRFMWWFSLLCIPVALLGYYTEAVRIAMAFAVVLTLISLCRSLALVHTRRAGATFVALACASGLFGSLAGVLTLLGILPGNFWLRHGFQTGTLGTVLAFHLALSARFRIQEQEHRNALDRAARAEFRAEQAHSARTQQQQFMAMLSHELRTPLAMIQGAAHGLKLLDATANPETSKRHGRIQRGIDRITDMLNQLLTSDRVDDEGLVAQIEEADLTEACGQVVSGIESQQRVQFNADFAIRARVDIALFQIVVGNLLDNALKYSPAGSPVALSVVESENAVHVRVDDHGKGVPEELVQSLFLRYIRGSSQGDIPGTGLGLYIVRKIAHLHGGEVSLERNAHGGCCFRVTFPRQPVADSPNP
ncbi:hypothetical protein CEW87_17365 [Parazoarcus communis]|uniref:histidine kinase n=1 Tax=Parazoarcus communis TaxID=41977 RepID=A0A2U8H8C8_9RHOO|nr:sensor histidine kinase [Parazoarcus communis]AWI80975.1 hypothetical protein CEW87_17365 [Parazoarcus communis]